MNRAYLHIGFSKCASTYIQHVLRTSNQINLIYKSKEFSLNDEARNSYEISEDRINIESDEHIILPSFHPELRVKGTRMEDVKDILQNIYQTSPNTKIILVIRNQIDLIKSRYSQYIIGGGGTLEMDDFCKQLNGNYSKEHDYYQNYYYRIIIFLEDLFGRDNLLIFLFEDFKNENSSLLSKLEEFIDVKLQELNPGLISMRKGMSSKGLRQLRKLNFYFVREKQDMYGNIDTYIPLPLYIQLVRLLRGVDYYFGKGKIDVPKHVQEKLNEKFQSDNQLLAKYLNRDLKELGYNY